MRTLDHLVAHLGRPKGRDEQLGLRPVADRLAELLGEPVVPADSLDDVPDGDGVMLENVRFEPAETKNDAELAKRYAALADVYVLELIEGKALPGVEAMS